MSMIQDLGKNNKRETFNIAANRYDSQYLVDIIKATSRHR